jgi:hypothetical protein
LLMLSMFRMAAQWCGRPTNAYRFGEQKADSK